MAQVSIQFGKYSEYKAKLIFMLCLTIKYYIDFMPETVYF